MALKMDVTTVSGLYAPAAYLHAVPAGFHKDWAGKWFMAIHVTVFKDAASATGPGAASLVVPHLDRFKVPYPLSSTGNAIKQAYVALKKLPQFASAEDA